MAALVGLLALPAAAAAQAWLPAATAAAQTELSADWGHAEAVTLSGAAVQALTVDGLSGFYTAAVDGTPWLAWGLLDADGAIAAAAVARAAEPSDAVPFFAGQLATFWAGEGPFDLFFAVPSYLAGHAVSVEMRASFLRAVMDLRAADPERSPGPACRMTVPFHAVFSGGDFPLARLAALTRRAVAEWDLETSPHQLDLGSCPGGLWGGVWLRLSLRGAGEEATLQALLQEIVGSIVAADRSAHPGFHALLQALVAHHLNVLDFWGHPQIAGRDPLVVHAFLHDWWQDRPPLAGEPPVVATMRLFASLPASALAERAEARGWALQGLAEWVDELEQSTGLGSAWKIVAAIAGTSFFGGGDVRWLMELDVARRATLVRLILERYDGVDFLPIERAMVRFLAWAMAHRALPPEQVAAVRALLARELATIVERRLAIPLPPLDSADADLEEDLAALAEIVDATGADPPAEPLFEAWLTALPGEEAFPGGPLLGGETPEHLAERRALSNALLDQRGVVVLDGARAGAWDLGFLHDLDRFLAVADPHVRQGFGWWVIAHSPAPGATAGTGGFVYLYPQGGEPTADELNARRLSNALLVTHEVGHLVHRLFPLEIDVRWRRLYERTSGTLPSPGAYDPDHFFAELPGYAATEANEDAAEHLGSWMRDTPGFLAHAVAVAQQSGKLALLEKFLLLAEALSRPGIGVGDSFPMVALERVERAWADGGNELRYRLADVGRVRSRDALGRVVELADATRVYRFDWAGDRLGGLTVEPRARGDFHTVPPCRLLDTRLEGPAVVPGAPRALRLGERCGVPAAAQAIAANVTVLPRGSGGHLTAGPGGAPLAAASTLNFTGLPRANNAVVPVGPDGDVVLAVTLAGPGAADVIVDVSGYFD